ncbi:hypothetical transmembrane protein [Mycoplasma mycoides subsp. mycoides SC str. PG1]|uniref:Hypothetical transmembrane protein n=1 Tax=Mycoplasma mycoides subsp. mycoides SC (strain CCUG 32753 / NCTC 10114 / PG1) TaxID=272632 RepID=Q6MTX0_MYCMS|nr:hypothetical transmembrane protein [Mycoplasma mycoides subsp. mycoides SC str. PG1]
MIINIANINKIAKRIETNIKIIAQLLEISLFKIVTNNLFNIYFKIATISPFLTSPIFTISKVFPPLFVKMIGDLIDGTFLDTSCKSTVTNLSPALTSWSWITYDSKPLPSKLTVSKPICNRISTPFFVWIPKACFVGKAVTNLPLTGAWKSFDVG